LTALHLAAQKGHAAVVEQLISAGATVDAADKYGRGPGRVFGSFRSGSDEVMEGAPTLAGDFRALLWDVVRYLLLKDPLLCSNWCLGIWGKEMIKHGGHEWKARGLKC